MKVFRFDKKKDSLAVQSLIMIIVAAIMFYSYSHSKQMVYLVLLAFSMFFVAIYFYRILFMRIVFSDEKVIFKGLNKKHTILKSEIHDILIFNQVGREVKTTPYSSNIDIRKLGPKSYIIIRRNNKILQTSLSMLNAASDDYITLEYTNGLEKYLDKLLDNA